MNIARVIAFLGIVAMSIGLINGFVNGDFFEDGGELFNNPWGVMSIIDLYVGFVLFSLWIVYREANLVVIITLVVLMMILGFFTASVYLFYLLMKEDNLKKVMLGKHYEV